MRSSLRPALRWRLHRFAVPGALALAGATPWAAAQSVSLAGQMGSKALLVIDGQTRMLAPGESEIGRAHV